MKITEITYEQLINTGNFENKRVGATASLIEGDDPELVYKQLRDFVVECLIKFEKLPKARTK